MRVTSWISGKRLGPAFWSLAVLSAQALEFGWTFPVDGAFNDKDKWSSFPTDGYPTGSDLAIFTSGNGYTVTCDGASSGILEVGGSLTFQLDGNYRAGECHLGGGEVVLRGAGTFSGGPLTVSGSLLADGAGLTMSGLSFSTTVRPELTGRNEAQITSSGPVLNCSKPLLETGSEWRHTGALNVGWCFVNSGALLAADELTLSQADVDGGRIQAGHLIASGIRAKNGATINNSSVALTGERDTLLEGADTRWRVSGTLDAKTSQTDVQTGAILSAGALTGSGGFYTVDGNGSQLIVTTSIMSETITVRNQGRASAASLSKAAVSVRDANSSFAFESLAEDTGVLIFNGGRVTGITLRAPMSPATEGGANVSVQGAGSALLLDGNLALGPFGQASLSIQNGGRVECAEGILNGGRIGGFSNGSVSGADSFWLARNGLVVGDDNGQATLNLDNGGRVEVRGRAVAVGLQAGGQGTVTVDGGPTLSPSALDTRLSPEIGVGVGGKGLLRVRNRGRIVANRLTVGVQAKSDGTLEVIGAGSSLEVSGTLEIGEAGPGQLTLFSGGLTTAQDVVVGSNTGNNFLRLTGSGSTLTVTKALHVGETGSGRLTLEPGTRVELPGNFESDTGFGVASVANQPGSVGSITVNGTGSAFVGGQGALIVGTFGQGTLNVINGGQANFNRVAIGGGPGASGVAVIAGSGSVLRANDRLLIGGTSSKNSGPGDVTVSAGGLLRSGFNLNIYKSAVLRLSGGAAIVGQSDESAVLGTVLVGNQGRFNLGGKLVGSVLVRPGGQLLPGSSPGHAAIDGNLTLAVGTTLEMELGGIEPGITFDQIEATGTITQAGQLNFVFRDGFAPTNGQTFELIHGGQIIGDFSDVSVRGLAPGFTYTLGSTGGKTLQLTATRSAVATTVPELNVIRSAAGEVVVFWLESASGSRLEQTSNLTSPAWHSVVAPGNRVTIPASSTASFFRLVPL